ncbi:MAG: dienelactone hydrolase family protein [Planctomycetes bacterium]|nr:dienelactone hydrolase family protein [Planctomycetota bacterium]
MAPSSPRPHADGWQILLALALTPLLSTPLTAQSDDFQAGQVKVDGKTFPYRLLAPAKMEEGKRYPLVLFLHGAGERGENNSSQLRHFPERMASAEYRQKYPCFVLAPQCPEEQTWVEVNWSDKNSTPISDTPTPSMRAAILALQEVVNSQPVDAERILLTGLSMGGYGAWDLAMRHADWFAAAVPICGGGDERAIARLAGLPMQVWHGGSDGVVPPKRSRVMVKAAKELGMKIDYHEVKGIGHNSWVEAYGDDGCLDWLLAAKRNPGQRQLESARLLAQAMKKNEHVAFLGDSITQAGNAAGGYVDQIRKVALKMQPEAVVIPAGISGHKVPDLLKRVQRDVIDKKATLVFIYIGINDVWHSQSGNGTPPEQFESGLHTLIQQLKASGADVVLATPSVIGEKPAGENSLDKMLADYAAISRRVAAKENLILCDLSQSFADHLSIFNPKGLSKGVLTSDGVHLNPAGNTFLATEAAQALLRHLNRVNPQ